MGSKKFEEIRIRIYNEGELFNFINSQQNKSEYLLNLARMDMNGDLILNAKESIEILRKEKLQVDIEYKKLVNAEKNEIKDIEKRKLEAETKIAEYHADHLNIVGSTPSRQSKEAMEYHVTKNPRLNPHTDEVQRKYIYSYETNAQFPHKTMCKICEILFESTEKHVAIDDVVWHIEEIHNQRAETVVRRD